MSSKPRSIVAIDGPAGAGKSTVARRLAARLGWRYLDTGALYRTVTLAVLRAGVSPADEEAVARLAEAADIEIRDEGGVQKMFLGGEDVSAAIRSPDVAKSVPAVAALARVRSAMVRLQRAAADAGPLVAEGRDIGTVVFPDAGVKFYLDADSRVRATRRAAEMGESDVAAVERAQSERDRQDETRHVSPLVRAADAIYIDSAGETVDAIVDAMLRRVRHG